MILKLIMRKENMSGMRVTYQFRDVATSNIVATAAKNFKEFTSLFYENSEYEICTYPEIIEKPYININYPLSSKKDETLGLHITENGDCVAKFYSEAATVGKIGFLKLKIGFTIFEYQGEPYMVYRVGLRKESSHFYCLYNNYGETVAIIEKHRVLKDNSIAMIYIETDVDEHIIMALFACTVEIICLGGSENIDDMDFSAGKYISLFKEEKAMLNKSFIARVVEKDLPKVAEELKMDGPWSSLFGIDE